MRSWLKANWIPLLVISFIGLLPFLPTLLSGKLIFANDQVGSPALKWYFDPLRHGHFSMWVPYVLGGMPTFDSSAGDATYFPFMLLGLLLPAASVITWSFMLHLVLRGLFGYFLLQRYFRLDKWLAAPLSISYMLATDYISHIAAGHTGKFYVMSWLPLALYFLLRSMGPTRSWKHFLGLSLVIAVFIMTSHLQFTYFALMGFFLIWLYFMFPALRSRRLAEAGGLTLRFWVPILLGLGIAFFNLYPPMKYTKEFGIRGSAAKTTYEHATSWSMNPEETASLIVPEFTGLNQNYWGRNLFKLNSEYPGLLIWFLGLLGLFAFRGRWFWSWASLGILVIIYALGANTPFFKLFYEFIPGIKNFRAPSMVMFWLVTSLVMMSAETIRRLTVQGQETISEPSRKKILKGLYIGGFSVAGFFALCGLAPDTVFSIWNGLVDGSELHLANQARATAPFAIGALRAAILTAVLTWAVAAFLLKSRQIVTFGLIALAVTVVDTYWVNSNFIRGYNVEEVLLHDPAINVIKADTSRFRLLGMPGSWEKWHPMYYEFETVDSWTDNEMKQYRRYRGDDYMQNPNLMAGLRQNPDGSVSGSNFLDLLNVKYIAFRTEDNVLRLALNSSMLPRTFFVPHWEVVSDSEALWNMKAPGFNPRSIAYVTGKDIASGGSPSDSNSPLITGSEKSFQNNYRSYVVDAPSEGVFIASDMWFPFWQVRVDGVRAPLLRTDFAFQGVLLKPGRHEVSFSYHSEWIRKGFIFSLFSILGLLLCIGVIIFGRLDPSRSPSAS